MIDDFLINILSLIYIGKFNMFTHINLKEEQKEINFQIKHDKYFYFSHNKTKRIFQKEYFHINKSVN